MLESRNPVHPVEEDSVQWRRAVLPVLVWVVGIGLAAVTMILAPVWIVGTVDVVDPVRRLELENSVRGVIVPGLASSLFVVTAYLTWRQVEATSRQIDATQQGVRLAQDQLALGARTNVSERFVRAVELLSSQQVTARVGGIYALESIAADEPTYHRTVQELLAASAREQAPNELALTTRRASASPADVRSVLRVLARQPMSVHELRCRSASETPELSFCEACGDPPDEGGGARRADLSRIVLERLDLAKGCLDRTRFRGAVLNHCDLEEASLIHADLRSAVVRKTNLRGACLAWADISGAVFRRCNLAAVTFSQTNLSHARLEWCVLGGANLGDWQIERLSLRGSILDETTFEGTRSIDRSDLRQVWGNVDFSGLKLHYCDFSRATLFRRALFNEVELLRCTFEGTEFVDVEITKAWLGDCKFPGAKMHVMFRETVFQDVDFSSTDFDQAMIWFEDCYSSRGTRWPPDHQPGSHRIGVEVCDDHDPRLYPPGRKSRPPI